MMIAVCDGCGAQEPAFSNGRDWFKPLSWYERSPPGESRPVTACSRRCIDLVEQKRREGGLEATTVVLPI